MKRSIFACAFFLGIIAPASAKMISNPKIKPIKICIVRVSEADEKKYGDLPWPRSFHANLVQKLEEAGASWVGLKFLFEESTNEASDGKLIAVCRRFSNVILPNAYAAIKSPEPFDPASLDPFTLRDQTAKTRFLSFPSAFVPFKELGESASGIGNMNMKTQAGKFVSYPLAVRIGGKLTPSFALAVAARARGYNPADLEVFDGELHLGHQQLPMDEEGMIPNLKLSPPEKSYRSYDYSQIVNNEFRSGDVFGAIVLVGYGGKKMDADFITEVSERHNSIYIDADAIKQLLTTLKDVY